VEYSLVQRVNYEEAIDFLFRSLPMFQQVGAAAYKATLDNTLKLDAYFGHPHRRFPIIHVAGTNGKGSVCHMLASVLQESGFRTGLYTSPHLLDFRERIRIDGKPIPEEEVTRFVSSHQGIISEISPSFFEMTVAMAFDYFEREQVGMAVIETGMGGRLDSTNIVSPVLTVITNISPDHQEFLGNDLRSIAREKGGIIKPGVPLVIGKTPAETEEVLTGMAAQKQAPVLLARQRYETAFSTLSTDGTSLIRIKDLQKGEQETYSCALAGDYQQENVPTVLTALSSLAERGYVLPSGAVQRGLAGVIRNTGIMGRWQTLGSNPRSICDTAHNEAGIAAVIRQVMQVPFRELHIVFGMVKDKKPDRIIPLLPTGARYYFTQASIPRSLDAAALRSTCEQSGLTGEAYGTVIDAYRAAMESAGPDDLVFTGGSTFVVADLLRSLGY
jgi:dihydrofolate synthase/folylpolyglutamate synthase